MNGIADKSYSVGPVELIESSYNRGVNVNTVANKLSVRAGIRACGNGAGISVVDTTGAGDIFGGAAISQILKYEKAPESLHEEQLRAIVRFACTAAGLSTTEHGGISSVPTLEAVLEKMQ